MKLDISLQQFPPRTDISSFVLSIFLCSQVSYIYKDIRLSNPMDTHTSYVYRFLAEREAIAFFIITLQFRSMPRTNEIREGKKYSNARSTSNSRKTVPYREFETEMNAKNKAYLFILSHNLLNEFTEFCKNHHSDDPHSDCLSCLLEAR